MHSLGDQLPIFRVKIFLLVTGFCQTGAVMIHQNKLISQEKVTLRMLQHLFANLVESRALQNKGSASLLLGIHNPAQRFWVYFCSKKEVLFK